jgi:hypothetical protein
MKNEETQTPEGGKVEVSPECKMEMKTDSKHCEERYFL